jgi:hypothetical protein
VVVGRERWGQVLVVAGLLALVLSLGAAGASRELRDTDAIRRAAPDVLMIPSVRANVAAELGRAIELVYAPRRIPADTLAVATERMAQNGYVIDEFQDGLAAAHRRWLGGEPMLVELDPRVITQAAVTGLRDADLDLANDLPSGSVVEPGPIPMPLDLTAGSVASYGSMGRLAALASLVAVGAGAVLSSRRSKTVKAMARGLCGAGLMLVAAALVLPLPALREVNDLVAVLGAMTGQSVVRLLVVGGLLVFVGLWLHAKADRLVSTVERQVRSIRQPKAPAPVRTGSRPTRRGTGRHRREAIDAFFAEQPAPERTSSIILIDEMEDELAGGEPDPEPVDDEPPLEPVVEPQAPAAELAPQDERAAALAADRREALARIDGRQSRNRTHLRR